MYVFPMKRFYRFPCAFPDLIRNRDHAEHSRIRSEDRRRLALGNYLPDPCRKFVVKLGRFTVIVHVPYKRLADERFASGIHRVKSSAQYKIRPYTFTRDRFKIRRIHHGNKSFFRERAYRFGERVLTL